jgi:hypothetical protein
MLVSAVFERFPFRTNAAKIAPSGVPQLKNFLERTMRHIALCLCLVIVSSCGSQPIQTLPTGAPPAVMQSGAPVYVAPTPTIPEPERYFADADNMADWIDQTVNATLELKNAPRPEPELEVFKHFTLKPENLADDLGFWRIDNSRSPVDVTMPPPHLSDVINLESQGERLAAGEKFAELGMTEDVRRCLGSLQKDGEWKAVAMLAILLDDTKSLDHATDILMKDDHVSRTKDLIEYAVLHQHGSMADHLAERHHFNVVAELDQWCLERLAQQGDVKYYADWVESQIGTDLENYYAQAILTIAKHDKPRALQLAEKYLGWKDACVLIEYCSGECGNKHQRGAMELYHLVKEDQHLRQLYIESFARLWKHDPPSRGPLYLDYGPDDIRLVTSELALLVKETGDKDLIAAMLTGLEAQTPGFERESSVLILGGTPILEAEGVHSHEAFLLDWARSGKQPDREVPTSDSMNWNIHCIAKGDIPLDVFKAEWMKLGLPTASLGKKYTKEEADQAIELVKQGGIGDAAGMQIAQDILLSGFTVPDDLSFKEVTPEFAYVQATHGKMQPANKILLMKVYAQYSKAYLEQELALSALEALLDKILEAAQKNVEVVQRGGKEVIPSDREQAYELIAESLTELRQDRRDAYITIVADLTQTYSWLYERESEVLARAGEIVLLQDLANAINRPVLTAT